jgi:hypothetical protein
MYHIKRGQATFFRGWRRLYGEKTVRKAERAWLLSEEEESEAWIRVAFDSLGQKQRVFEPYRLSLSFKVASSIPKYSWIMTDYFLIMKTMCLRQDGKHLQIRDWRRFWEIA